MKQFLVNSIWVLLFLLASHAFGSIGTEAVEYGKNNIRKMTVVGSPAVGYWYIDLRTQVVANNARITPLQIPGLKNNCPDQQRDDFAAWFNAQFLSETQGKYSDRIHPIGNNSQGALIIPIGNRGIVIFDCAEYKFYPLKQHTENDLMFVGEAPNGSLWFYSAVDAMVDYKTGKSLLKLFRFQDKQFNVLPSPIDDSISGYHPAPIFSMGDDDNVCGIVRGTIACVNASAKITKSRFEIPFMRLFGPYAFSTTSAIIITTHYHHDTDSPEAMYLISLLPETTTPVKATFFTNLPTRAEIRLPLPIYKSIFSMNEEMVMHNSQRVYTINKLGKCSAFIPGNMSGIIIFKSDDSHVLIIANDAIYRIPIPLPVNIAQSCSN